MSHKLIKKSLFAVLLAVFSFSLQALTMDQLRSNLTEHKLLRGEFAQSKTLQIFNKPLLSSGSFLLDHQQGLLWSQRKPFAVSLVLAADKLSQQFGSQQAEIIEAKDNPMVFYFSRLFLSLFKGDIEALDEQFIMQLTGLESNWSLLLTPKSAPLNKVFATISISGGEYIKELLLTELSGDASEITFSNQQSIPSELTEDEKDAFKF